MNEILAKIQIWLIIKVIAITNAINKTIGN